MTHTTKIKLYLQFNVCTLVYVILLLTSTAYSLDLTAQDGQKEGIYLRLQLAELQKDSAIVTCEIENTTDKAVAFQLTGSVEGPALQLHLYDNDDKEISKLDTWIRDYETGDSLHIRYAVIKSGEKMVLQNIDLQAAYGENWIRGKRLLASWNSREKRTGPGPYGGVFGVGSGVSTSCDITPLVKINEQQNSNKNDKQPQNVSPNTEATNIISSSNQKNKLLTHTNISWVAWSISLVILIFIVVLIRILFSRRSTS